MTIADNIIKADGPASDTTSASEASLLGASDDQAKMAGTKASKDAKIADRIDSTLFQQKDLARVERLTEAPREPTPQEKKEKDTADSLAKLGNVGSSIKNRIMKSIADAGAAAKGTIKVEQTHLAQTLGLTGAALDAAKKDPLSKYSKSITILQTYLDSPTANNLETAMAALDALKATGMRAKDARNLVGLTQENIAVRTGEVVAENVMDTVTMADIDASELGFGKGNEEVAELLGMDLAEFNLLTVDELSDVIDSRVQSEYANVAKKKAEMIAAPKGSLQYEALVKELRGLGQAGVTGIESMMAQTAEEINLADKIVVGEKTFTVKEFLDDDKLSTMVEDFIKSDPAGQDKIFPNTEEYQGLRAWIKSNASALGELMVNATDTLEVYTAAGEAYSNMGKTAAGPKLNDDVMAAAVPGWDPKAPHTSEEVHAAQDSFNASTIGTLSSTSDLTLLEKADIFNSMNNAEDPATVQAILDRSIGEVKTAHAAAKDLKDNTYLSDFLGVGSQDGFVFSGASQAKIAEYKEVMGKIANEHPSWLQDKTSLAYKAMQKMSPDELAEMVRVGGYDSLVEKETILKDYSEVNIEDNASLAGFVFEDPTFDMAAVEDSIAETYEWARRGDENAIRKANLYAQLFGWNDFGSVNNPGTIDLNDMRIEIGVSASHGDNSIRSAFKKKWEAIKSAEGPNTEFDKYLPLTPETLAMAEEDGNSARLDTWAKDKDLDMDLGGQSLAEYRAGERAAGFQQESDWAIEDSGVFNNEAELDQWITQALDTNPPIVEATGEAIGGLTLIRDSYEAKRKGYIRAGNEEAASFYDTKISKLNDALRRTGDYLKNKETNRQADYDAETASMTSDEIWQNPERWEEYHRRRRSAIRHDITPNTSGLSSFNPADLRDIDFSRVRRT